MRNPWHDTPLRAPYVLPDDRPFIEAFNRYWKKGTAQRIRLEMFPDPFIGSRNAPVVVLALNPGVGGREDLRLHKTRRDLVQLMYFNLVASPSRVHHTYLLEQFEGTPGARWWQRATARLSRDGITDAALRSRVLSIEFHGYHSHAYSTMPVTLPSQYFGFHLVNQAIDRGAVILVMRAERNWHIAVPELGGYDRVLCSHNPRTSSISPNVYGRKAYRLILEALDS